MHWLSRLIEPLAAAQQRQQAAKAAETAANHPGGIFSPWSEEKTDESRNSSQWLQPAFNNPALMPRPGFRTRAQSLV